MDERDYMTAKAEMERAQRKVQRLSPSPSGILRSGRGIKPETPKELAQRLELEAACADLAAAKLAVETVFSSLTVAQREAISIAAAQRQLAERQ